MGGPGSEKFNIDEKGNITLKEELDFEETKSYDLLIFTFLGEKSITNKLNFNIVDFDEEPLVSLNIFASSFLEDISTNTKLGEVDVVDPEKNGISYSVTGLDKDKVSISESGSITLSQTLDYEEKKDLDFVLEIFDGKNTVSTPVKIKIDNVMI